jgi:hypothetical protein
MTLLKTKQGIHLIGILTGLSMALVRLLVHRYTTNGMNTLEVQAMYGLGYFRDLEMALGGLLVGGYFLVVIGLWFVLGLQGKYPK